AATAAASPAAAADGCERPGCGRRARRAGLRAERPHDQAGRARHARPRVRRFQLRRHRRHREGGDLRLAARQGHERRHQGGADAHAPGRGRRGGAGQEGRLRRCGRLHPFEAADNVSVYGGYRPDTWARSLTLVTSVTGSPEAILAARTTGVVLQHLTVRGTSESKAGGSAYGIRLAGGSKGPLRRVLVSAGPGAAGAPPAFTATTGAPGGAGAIGSLGECDGKDPGRGGRGGSSPAGRLGGRGGDGGNGDNFGARGSSGDGGT